MSVLIRGMEMPTRCEACPVFDPEMDECALIGKTPWSWEDETGISTIHRRPDNCPLVPVPKHGDLIDRDALCDGLVSNHPVVIHAKSAPTIIPTEEGET